MNANTANLIAALASGQTTLLIIDLVQLLSQDGVTDADWDALRLKWSKPYAQKEAEAEARLAAETAPISPS